MGATLNGSSNLDIESELRLVEETKRDLQLSETDALESTDKLERTAMKELGIKRARKFGWPNTYVFTKALGEMVLGHMRGDVPLVIIRPTIITSLYKEPLPGWMEGIRTIDSFILGYAKGNLSCYLADLKEIMDVALYIVNLLLCGRFSHRYNELRRQYQYIMHLVDLYSPYTFFRGRFDDMNLQRLKLAIEKDTTDAQLFCFDPRIIDWDNYFYLTHIPGVLKFLHK